MESQDYSPRSVSAAPRTPLSRTPLSRRVCVFDIFLCMRACVFVTNLQTHVLSRFQSQSHQHLVLPRNIQKAHGVRSSRLVPRNGHSLSHTLFNTFAQDDTPRVPARAPSQRRGHSSTWSKPHRCQGGHSTNSDSGHCPLLLSARPGARTVR